MFKTKLLYLQLSFVGDRFIKPPKKVWENHHIESPAFAQPIHKPPHAENSNNAGNSHFC